MTKMSTRQRYFSMMMVLFCMTTFLLPDSGLAQPTKKPIELRWVTQQALATLDPMQVTNNPSWSMAPNLYDTLVFPNEEKGYIPWIAESWKVSTDGMKYTFLLKKGIPFHDGTEMTAEDVVFSMERLLTMKQSTVAQYFKYIKPGTTKALDRYTVEFNLSEKAPQFMAFLFAFRIMNKELILKNKASGPYGEFGDYGVDYLRTHDAGSGPYMAVEHKQGNYFRMKRFEEYSIEPWKPNSIDIVTTYVIPEAVTEATKLRAGELDMGEWTLPAITLKEFQKNENFTVAEELTDGVWIGTMNNKKKPFDDPYVRKAVAHAYNAEVVAARVFGGGKPARGPLPETMRGSCTDIPYYPYDLEKARTMLKKSRYSAEELKGFEIEIGEVGGNEQHTNTLLMLYSDLKKIGLNAKIVSTTWVNICQRARKPETAFHLAFQTQYAKLHHSIEFLTYYTEDGWGATYPLGGMYYSNPKVTEAIKTASNFSSIEEQRKYYCVAQKQIAEDSPIIFSHTVLRFFPFWRYVKGYKYPAGCEFYQLRFNRFTMDTEDPMFKKNHGG